LQDCLIAFPVSRFLAVLCGLKQTTPLFGLGAINFAGGFHQAGAFFSGKLGEQDAIACDRFEQLDCNSETSRQLIVLCFDWTKSGYCVHRHSNEFNQVALQAEAFNRTENFTRRQKRAKRVERKLEQAAEEQTFTPQSTL